MYSIAGRRLLYLLYRVISKKATNRTIRERREKKKTAARAIEMKKEPRNRIRALVLDTRPDVSGRCTTYFD
jgi:hypothetical protein